MILSSVFSLSLLLSTGPPTPAPAWKQEKGRDGMRIETRQLKSGFDEIRVSADIDRPAALACDVLWDMPNHLDAGLKKRQPVTATANERWTYERVAAPFADRDYTLHMKRESTVKGCHIGFDTQNDKGPPPVKGVVRLPLIRGEWSVEDDGEEGDGHAARVVYTVYAEPGNVAPVFARGPQFERSVAYAQSIVARIKSKSDTTAAAVTAPAALSGPAAKP